MFLDKNGVGVALAQQVSIDRVVEGSDVDGFQSEQVAIWARMRRLSNPGDGNILKELKKYFDVLIHEANAFKKHPFACALISNYYSRCLGSSRSTLLSVPAVRLGQVRQIWVHVLVLGKHSLVDVQFGPSFGSFHGCILLSVRSGCVYQLRHVLAELFPEPGLLVRWISRTVWADSDIQVSNWLDCCLARESWNRQRERSKRGNTGTISYHPTTKKKTVEHERLCRSLQKECETKMAVVGKDDLAKEASVLNRIARWHPQGDHIRG